MTYWAPTPRTPHLAALRADYETTSDLQARSDLATRIRWIEAVHACADDFKLKPRSDPKSDLCALWALTP
jgi:hypothetical protein